MIFLDFDRTLFDTDAFNATLADEPACAPYKEELRAVIAAGRDETLTGGERRAALWKVLNAAAEVGAVTFPPGYLSRFIYPDVEPALTALGKRAVIITFGNPAWQRLKVESSLPGLASEVHYFAEGFKAAALAGRDDHDPENSILVDDRAAELAAAADAFPQMRLYEMRRDGKEGSGRWPVIRSLAELVA
jgi:FMN phosphatase YigB (HAD superfamily)